MCPECLKGQLKYLGFSDDEGVDYWKCDNPDCGYIGDEVEIVKAVTPDETNL